LTLFRIPIPLVNAFVKFCWSICQNNIEFTFVDFAKIIIETWPKSNELNIIVEI
jgi:hypothetical protein